MILDEYLAAREMRAVEENAAYLGVSRLQLMENAGRAVADAVMSRFGAESKVAVVCGPGGNGGDGMVAARHLAGAGYHVKCTLLGSGGEIRSKEARANWLTVEQMRSSLAIVVVGDSEDIPPLEADVVIDALIGTGFRGALASPYRQMVEAINRSKGFKIAVDIPTGVEADTGSSQGEAVKADLILTFHKPKKGFRNKLENLGEVVVCSIGVPPEAELFTGPGDLQLVSKRRDPESHKGMFGQVLVVGGSETYSGAPALTAMGAYATGVDLVYVAVPETAASIVAGFSPSLITIKLDGERLSPRNLDQLEPFIDRADVVAMGPGLGLQDETVEAVEALIKMVDKRKVPVLIDADALKSYPRKRKVKTPTVFTPHSSEFEVLTGKEVSGGFEEKGEIVQGEAARLGATVLLKGRVDVVSDGERTRYNWTGNPGMTVGGTGDVLSGVVSGFMAQGASPFEAAAAGAFVNGKAGDLVFGEKGYHLLPEDLVKKIPYIIEDALAGRLRASV